MAQRIGKYKLSKKESELSIIDGGTVTGALTTTSTVNISQSVFTTTSNPASAGQLFVTSSAAVQAQTTGSARILMVSTG